MPWTPATLISDNTKISSKIIGKIARSSCRCYLLFKKSQNQLEVYCQTSSPVERILGKVDMHYKKMHRMSQCNVKS